MRIATTSQQVQVLIIEDDPLTAWSLRNCLRKSFDVVVTESVDDALPLLESPELKIIICGTPVMSHNPAFIDKLARNHAVTVIALVSDAHVDLPNRVHVVEKPFVLEQLYDLLSVYRINARR